MGLVSYASSDEEDDDIKQEEPQESTSSESLFNVQKPAQPSSTPATSTLSTRLTAATRPSISRASDQAPFVGQHTAPLGPSLPSIQEQTASYSYAYPEQDDDDGNVNGPTSRPVSPYTATRSLLHDLTLPRMPNLDIPPSPPGSPPRETTEKFERFLRLKREQGVHFNKRLVESAAAGNPSLMDRLMKFVGLGDLRSQYETGVFNEVIGWEATGFPDEAFRTALKQGQEKVSKEKERERSSGGRTAIEFAKPVE